MSHFYNQPDLKLTINQSQLGHAHSPPLPSPLQEVCLSFFETSHFHPVVFSFVLLWCCDYMSFGFTKLNAYVLSAHNILKQPISWLCDALICQCYAKLHLGIYPLNAMTSNCLTNWEVKNSMLANYWIAKLQKTIILFLNVLKICFIQIPNESKILLW